MPSKKTVTTANLEALGAPPLAALLVELADGDAALKRRLRGLLAAAEGPTAAAQEVRKRLATLAKARSFIDWRRNGPLAEDLDAQRAAIVGQILPADPALALDLLGRFMALAEPTLSRCDDSNGRVVAVFRAACDDLCAAAAIARPDPIALADTVFAAIDGPDFGQFDDLIPGMAEPLGPDGLAHLEARVRAAAVEPVDVADPDAVVGWGAGGPVTAGQMAALRRERTTRRALLDIADARGDVDSYVAGFSAEERAQRGVAVAIAERLSAAGRHAEALAALDAAAPETAAFGTQAWEAARIAALDALGRKDEAQATRWAAFARRLDADPLREFLKRLPDFDDIDAEARAMALAAASPVTLQALAFFLCWPALDRAAALIIDRRETLDGDAYALLSPAAEALAEAHPLASTLALRAMVDFTLAEARSSRYGHAARHLAACARLARRIDDWAGAPDHDAWAAGLRADHGRKAGFWARVA